PGAGQAPHESWEFAWCDDPVGAEAPGMIALVRVFRGGEEQVDLGVADECRDREQTERSRADDGGRAARSAGGDEVGGVDGAGRWFDHDRFLIAQIVRDGKQLGGMGDHLGGPAPAGVLTEPGLETRFEMAVGDTAAVVGVADGAGGTDRFDPAGGTGQDWYQHGSATGVGVRDDFVAWCEWEAYDRFEVAARVAVDHAEVRAADAGEAG